GARVREIVHGVLDPHDIRMSFAQCAHQLGGKVTTCTFWAVVQNNRKINGSGKFAKVLFSSSFTWPKVIRANDYCCISVRTFGIISQPDGAINPCATRSNKDLDSSSNLSTNKVNDVTLFFLVESIEFANATQHKDAVHTSFNQKVQVLRPGVIINISIASEWSDRRTKNSLKHYYPFSL